jgi:hypothetical protein
MDEKEIVEAIMYLTAIVVLADGAWKRNAEAERIFTEAVTRLEAREEAEEVMGAKLGYIASPLVEPLARAIFSAYWRGATDPMPARSLRSMTQPWAEVETYDGYVARTGALPYQEQEKK